MFDYKQRPGTKEWREGWDRVFGKKKRISLQEARKISLKIQAEAEKERSKYIEKEAALKPCNDQTTVSPITNDDTEEIKKLQERGIPVFYE